MLFRVSEGMANIEAEIYSMKAKKVLRVLSLLSMFFRKRGVVDLSRVCEDDRVGEPSTFMSSVTGKVCHSGSNQYFLKGSMGPELRREEEGGRRRDEG